jgi:hypothetical protein
MREILSLGENFLKMARKLFCLVLVIAFFYLSLKAIAFQAKKKTNHGELRQKIYLTNFKNFGRAFLILKAFFFGVPKKNAIFFAL